jgi:hypothetical protein
VSADHFHTVRNYNKYLRVPRFPVRNVLSENA